MKKSEFIEELEDILDVGELSESQKLHDLDSFDSLAVMSIAALIRTAVNVSIPGRAIKEAATVGSLLDMIGREKFE